MTVWLLEIFICNYDSEYGNIFRYYRESKVFDQKVKALNYMRDFKRKMSTGYDFEREYDVYPKELYGSTDETFELTEVKL